jgi:hypothetical protein
MHYLPFREQLVGPDGGHSPRLPSLGEYVDQRRRQLRRPEPDHGVVGADHPHVELGTGTNSLDYSSNNVGTHSMVSITDGPARA